MASTVPGTRVLRVHRVDAVVDAVLDAGVDLLLGSRCVGCERAGRLRCRACASGLDEPASVVWPSPVPLFVLGVALGYLATRTNRIAACAVLHGLFNAVSYVYVLRGGSG